MTDALTTPLRTLAEAHEDLDADAMLNLTTLVGAALMYFRMGDYAVARSKLRAAEAIIARVETRRQG